MVTASSPSRARWLGVLACLSILTAGGCLDARSGAKAELGEDATGHDATSPGGDTEVAERAGGVGEACLVNEDCAVELICGVDCDDWCDQTQWPNPCCTAACVERGGPWTCPASLGLLIGAAAPCPLGTTEARDPGDFVQDPAGNRCCLHDHCDWGSRTVCDASSNCHWRLADPPQRPNDGTCEPTSALAP